MIYLRFMANMSQVNNLFPTIEKNLLNKTQEQYKVHSNFK